MRLFVGLDFPDSVKDHLLRLETGLPKVRWSSREQLHLTLFFIGETEKNLVAQQALASIEAESFTLNLHGIGRFPENPKAPTRVLWAGVAESAALRQLQQQISSALVDIGFKADDRAFHPHVALARLKHGASLHREVDAYLTQHEAFEAAAIPVERFILYASQLTPQGAIYSHEAVYPLH